MERTMTIQEIESGLYSYLQLNRRVVGVKLFTDAKEFDRVGIPVRSGRSFYCQMIKMAAMGKSIKANLETFACDTGARMTGLKEYYEETEDVDGWYDMGAFADRKVAETMKETIRPVDEPINGVVTCPISEFGTVDLHEPDLVILAVNPRQAMRLMQAYTYHHGFKTDLKISGQCGVCFESTALPMLEKDITLSLLCSGTRYVCKWPDDVMMVSFPYEMAVKILEGLGQTAEVVESDEIKKNILKRLKLHGMQAIKKLTDKAAYFYKED